MRFARFNLLGKTSRGITIFFCLAIFLFVLGVDAQTAGTGNIQGVFADASGAVIPNASVIVTNTATQVKHTAISDGNGRYSFPNLAIGTYTMEATATGFSRYRQSNIVLDVGSSIAINISVKVGTADQVIEVQATELALQTEDSSLKQTVDSHTLTEMPLNGRQMTSLITLTGGAVNADENNDTHGSKSFWSSAVISVGGGQGNSTDYRLDGADHNDYMTNINLPFPFPDAVAEFSVEQAALGAQSGLHPGGLVNVVTRSGSNQWHGSAFEFIRNNYIDATNFFSTNKDTLHQNQFGGTFGGRIIRDKLFAFAGYQRLTNAQSQANTTAYVPTAANLLGDFSADLSSACQANPVKLVNPQTGAVLPRNQINPSYFNSAALALQKYLPVATNACGLVTYSIPSRVAENQFVTRVDLTINSRHSLYGRYLVDGYQSPAYFSPTNALITTQPGNIERVQAFTIGETFVITKNLVNAFHVSVTRRVDTRGPAAAGISPTTFGINMYVANPIAFQITTTNKWSTYCGTCAAAFFNVNMLSVADDVNWVHGKHQIAFGGEFVRAQLNDSNVYEGNGNWAFTGIFSKTGPAGASTGGTGIDANLDFLTGALNNMAQSKSQQNALRSSIPNLYIQDTYHVNKKIVLSAGVRWNPEYFPTDYFGRGSTFDYSAFLANTHSTVYPNAPAGTFFYGDSGVPKAYTKNSPWQFSPRFAATLDPTGTGKTVFRVGAALVYDEPNMYTAQRNQQNPPYAQTISNSTAGAPLNFSDPWSSGTTPVNPFPMPFKPTVDTKFYPQSQYIVLPAQYHSPYVMQWTASIQRELGQGWQFMIDYIGNETRFNAYGLPLSPAVYIPGTCGSSPCSTTGNQASRFALTRANPSQGPYYQGGGAGSTLATAGANASYNGVVVTLQHRMSSGFTMLTNYTWSHCIDIVDNSGDTNTTFVQNPANISGDKGSCGFDFRHVFNATLVASSHFALHGWSDQLVNHWEIAPLVHVTDGSPFTVVSGLDNSLTDVGRDRPNVTNPSAIYTNAKIMSGPSVNAKYINTAGFAQNPIGTFGNAGKNAYRGPKFFQFDSTLSRAFLLHEGLTMNLRLEAYNVFNHPNFAAPGSTAGYLGATTALTSSTFGEITSTTNNYGARIFQGAIKFVF